MTDTWFLWFIALCILLVAVPISVATLEKCGVNRRNRKRMILKDHPV